MKIKIGPNKAIALEKLSRIMDKLSKYECYEDEIFKYAVVHGRYLL